MILKPWGVVFSRSGKWYHPRRVLAVRKTIVHDPDWINIQIGPRIRIGKPDPDPGRLNCPPEKEK
jgi:hypothetical protein